MFINGKEFKPYDQNYYASADGDIYSVRSKRLLKHAKDLDGYHRVDLYGRHVKVHKIVYIAWIGPIPANHQINHKNDDKDDNHYTNLYAGTQKQNIADCIKNGTRKGHLKPITILDKRTGQLLRFEQIKDMIAYTGHKVANGSMSRLPSRKWFRERYEIKDV